MKKKINKKAITLLERGSKETLGTIDGLVNFLFEEAEDSLNVATTRAAPVASNEPKTPAEPVVMQNVSLDLKVDRYFVRYEREAISQSSIYGEAKKIKSLQQLLLEADEDEDLGEGDPAAPPPPGGGLDLGLGGSSPPGGDLGGPPPDLGGPLFLGGGGGGMGFGGGGGGGGGGDMGPPGEGAQPTPTPVINTPQINLNKFAEGIARLVNNYQVLLNPKSTILNRAKAYILNNYNEKTAKELVLILDQNFGLKAMDEEKTTPETPVGQGGGAMIMAGGP